MRVLRALCAGVAAICMLSSCALFNHRSLVLACSEHPFQGNSDPGIPLVVPEGMSPPETRNNVKIPVLNEPEQTRPRGCLAMPPSFSGGEAESVRTRVVPASAAPSPKLPLPQPQ